MTLKTMLLSVHICAGFLALAAAIVATMSRTLRVPHRWHVVSGLVFVWGMVAVFLTAVPLALAASNLFLVLIAGLSFYLAVAGWRFATNRRGTPRPVDWASAGAMVLASGVMIGFGGALLSRGDGNGVTMVVLGGIGAGLSLADLRSLRRGGVRGPERLAKHLTMMLGGANAAVTAFVVTNVSLQPAWVAWLAPTALIVPVIVVWARATRAGGRTAGMPDPP